MAFQAVMTGWKPIFRYAPHLVPDGAPGFQTGGAAWSPVGWIRRRSSHFVRSVS
jgi:hypothetical protein